MFFNTFRGERRRKEGTNLRIGWAFFLFKPKTCYSNRGQMLIDDLLRTRRRIFEKEDTKVYCSCVVFGQIPWRRNHLSTPSKYGRGHVGCIYLYRAAVAFRGSEKKAHWPTIQSDSIFSQRTQDKQDRFSSRHCFLPNSKTQIQNWPIFPKVQILIKL